MGLTRTFAVLAAAALVTGCAYNSQLGRSQLLLVDDAKLAVAAQQAWTRALAQGAASQDAEANARVTRVGKRIVEAAGLADRPWEYVVFDSADANAFVLPGGQVGVNMGLLLLVDNDDQLAAVIGHEMAHVIGRHAAERYSQEIATKYALAGAEIAASSNSDLSAGISAFGDVGAQVGVLLPFSRHHELEADRVGVDLMAKAGYRPAEALALWRMLAEAEDAPAKYRFMSTHPSNAERIAALERYLKKKGWL